MKEHMIQGGAGLSPERHQSLHFMDQALVFVPSAFHSMWHQRAGYLRSFLSCPNRVKTPRLKSKGSLQVFQSSLKLPVKEGPLDRWLSSVSASASEWEREGIDRYVPLGARVCLCAPVYRQTTWHSHGSTAAFCFPWGHGKTHLHRDEVYKESTVWSCFFLAPNSLHILNMHLCSITLKVL